MDSIPESNSIRISTTLISVTLKKKITSVILAKNDYSHSNAGDNGIFTSGNTYSMR